MARSVSLFLLATLAFVELALCAQKLPYHSFKPPFAEFRGGERSVSNWNVGGDAKVNKHFVRLTPDRQSKKGWMFAHNPIGARDWSVTLRFRLSGQAKSLYGDGIHFWYTNQRSSFNFNHDDTTHLSTDFTGFGILVDTFRNPETAHVHKDISVLLGRQDGSSPQISNEVARSGCDGNFRFHEKRDDFHADKSAFVQITFRGSIPGSSGKLEVRIDPQGTGTFTDCFTLGDAVPPNFDFNQAYFGISATTGALADNHDVIQLEAHQLDYGTEPAPKPLSAADLKYKEEDMNVDVENMDAGQIVKTMMDKVEKKIDFKLAKMEADIEHKMVGIMDHIRVAVQKLAKSEQQDSEAIRKLEEKVFGAIQSGGVAGSGAAMAEIQSELDKVRKQSAEFNEQVGKAFEYQGKSIEENIKNLVLSELDQAKAVAGGWKMPFFLFFFIVVAGGGYAFYRWRNWEKKFHYL